jgi:uncharacterized ion transporter superfamily protein YfcC
LARRSIPFATVIASNAAVCRSPTACRLRFLILGVGWLTCVVYVMRYAERVKRDPSKSLVANLAPEQSRAFPEVAERDGTRRSPASRKIILLLFG